MKEWIDALDVVIEAFKTGDWTKGLDRLHALKEDLLGAEQSAYDYAKDILDKDVRETAFNISSEVARQWRAGEFAGDRDSVYQSIEESCDAACTYTHRAQIILAMSRNDNAYLEEHGEMPDCRQGVPWSTLATMALRRDVIEHLQREPGVDLDEDPPETPLVDCGSCGDWKPGKEGICDECRDEDAEEEDQAEEPE